MPTKFLDGPAAGQVLCIGRAPFFLRVVRNRQGEWDCLDQPKDMPNVEEQIFVYRRVKGEAHPTVHLCRRPTGSGWFCVAEYVHHETQPDDETARSPGKWPKWCEKEYERWNSTRSNAKSAAGPAE